MMEGEFAGDRGERQRRAIYSTLSTTEAEQTRFFNELLLAVDVYQKEMHRLDQSADEPVNESTSEELANYIKSRRLTLIKGRSLDSVAEELCLKKEILFKLVANGKVLDAGSGFSSLSEQLEKNPELHCKVFNFDISQNALSLQGPEEKNVRANLTAPMPFAPDTFDTVIACNSLPLWANSAEEVIDSYSNLKSVLKVGGKILVSPISLFAARNPIPKGFRGFFGAGKEKPEKDPKILYVLHRNSLIFASLLFEDFEQGQFLPVLLKGRVKEAEYVKAAVIERIF